MQQSCFITNTLNYNSRVKSSPTISFNSFHLIARIVFEFYFLAWKLSPETSRPNFKRGKYMWRIISVSELRCFHNSHRNNCRITIFVKVQRAEQSLPSE